jgi:hypothetical protein
MPSQLIVGRSKYFHTIIKQTITFSKVHNVQGEHPRNFWFAAEKKPLSISSRINILLQE